ncbi:MAG: hypothetical protein KGJ06_05510 [Pseudomonadota bacterium]|nr:hypothetical protein [Pseudomonadota bacterium]
MATRRPSDTDLATTRTLIGGGRLASGLIPGMSSTVVGGGLDYIDAQLANQQEIQEFRQAGIDLEKAKSFSRAARRRLESMDRRASPVKIIAVTAASVVGAMAGGAFLVFLPFGALAGGAVGALGAGYLASRVYEGTMETTEQDSVALSARCYGKQCQQETVSDEEALANLVAALPERAQRKYEDLLERLAGTRDFAQAAQTREGQTALRRMMGDPVLENTLRAYTHIPLDPNEPTKNIAQQYAELINAGALDARSIILRPDTVGMGASRYYMQNGMTEGAGADFHAPLSAAPLPAVGQRNNRGYSPA